MTDEAPTRDPMARYAEHDRVQREGGKCSGCGWENPTPADEDKPITPHLTDDEADTRRIIARFVDQFFDAKHPLFDQAVTQITAFVTTQQSAAHRAGALEARLAVVAAAVEGAHVNGEAHGS